jgi:Flp pilus assembly secretin CpaC
VKKILLIVFCLLSAVSAVAEGNEITVKKGLSKILKIDNVIKIDVIKEDTVSAAVLSDKEVIVEGKKEGMSAINVTTPSGMETILVKVKPATETEPMIEIDMQIAEIIYSDDLQYGIDWPALISGGLPAGGLPLIPLQAIEQNPRDLNVLGGVFKRGPINAVLDALVTKNYAKILAKPKLRTISGKKAEFLSGGEIPFVLTDKDGKVTMQWKEYGVKIMMEPVLDKKNIITAKLRAEASTLDYANSVKFGTGGEMPAIRTRWAETTLSMEPEDTVILAGMLQNDESKVTAGVPLLSDIPLIGEIFKATHIVNKKTELVIFVTPKIGE